MELSVMSRITSLTLVVLTALVACSACVDPGCIRNSECGVGFDCKAARCVATTDAGVGTGKAGEGGSNADGGGLDAAADAAKM
jgi:hypothetical protein